MPKKPGGKKRRQLKPRQIAFVKELAKGKTLGKAAIAAGYTKKHPDQAGHQAMEQIKKSAPDLLARHGLDDDSLIEKYLVPLMTAQETKFFPHQAKQGRKTVHRIATRNVVNWPARREGLDMAFKIRGLYVREMENKGPEFSVVIINAANRPQWSKIKKAQPPIAVPGLPPPA